MAHVGRERRTRGTNQQARALGANSGKSISSTEAKLTEVSAAGFRKRQDGSQDGQDEDADGRHCVETGLCRWARLVAGGCSLLT